MFGMTVGAAPLNGRSTEETVEYTEEGKTVTAEISALMSPKIELFGEASQGTITCKAHLVFNNPVIGSRSASGSSSASYSDGSRALEDEISVKVKYYKGGTFQNSVEDVQKNASY